MSRNLLSKSTFIRSMQCQKSLFLYKRMRHLRDEISDEQQAIFYRGHSVGALARQLFPGGVDAGWKSPRMYKKSVEYTQKLINAGKTVVYEAAFLHEDILVAVDILVKENGCWHAYEVKSSLSPSATFLKDAALQYYVLSGRGLNIAKFNLVHLRREYVRGKKLDLQELFKTVDVTEQVKEKQRLINWGLGRAKQTLRKQFVPDVEIGAHCHNPYPCDFQGHCWSHILQGKTIFQLTELEDERRWMLFEQGKIQLHEIPEELPLTKQQKIQLSCLSANQLHFDHIEVNAILEKIKFPAAFAHVNVMRAAVPPVPGTKPYEQTPFLFSIDKLAHICAPPEKYLYLAEETAELQFKVLEHFLSDTEGVNTIVVHSAANELKALRDVSKKYPELQKPLEQRLKCVIDIAEIFSKKHIYHAQMGADNGLTTALSVLGLDASPTEINNNYMAGVGFENLFRITDMFYRMDVRNRLVQYAAQNSTHIYTLWKMLREAALEKSESLNESEAVSHPKI